MEPNTEKVYPPSSYLVAYKDIEFLSRDDLRPVRLQLELLKPELIMEEHKIVSTVVVFGSARLLSREEAEKNLADIEKKGCPEPGPTRCTERFGTSAAFGPEFALL